jgi:hypothetical protein
MGPVTADHLYHILWAANAFARNRDPAADINAYLNANEQWTANVRTDSGQPDGWRDYQQVLSELSLIYSVEVMNPITLTTLGLALLDGSLGFSEVMTLQALRFQYPNGHHTAISATHRGELVGTPFAAAQTFTELQDVSGVRLRPAVLVWRVLGRLLDLGSDAQLSVDDLERYLMRCSTNDDFALCADTIAAVRRPGGVSLPRLGTRQRRNAQDWTKFLRHTSIFTVTDGQQPTVRISDFGLNHAGEINDMCSALETATSFWKPGRVTPEDRIRWYSQFGGVDLALPELPEIEAAPETRDFVNGVEADDTREVFEEGQTGGVIELREFAGVQEHAPRRKLMIQSVYSAELTTSAHRLHDQMVLLIAQTCQSKGAMVFEDPNTVDLLVQHQQREFIVEVKSVTARNYIARLRYALGQVLQYDYLRTTPDQMPRRKVIAFAAHIPEQSWSVGFLNNHLDMDLLTLEAGQLRVYSPSAASIHLFG